MHILSSQNMSCMQWYTRLLLSPLQYFYYLSYFNTVTLAKHQKTMQVVVTRRQISWTRVKVAYRFTSAAGEHHVLACSIFLTWQANDLCARICILYKTIANHRFTHPIFPQAMPQGMWWGFLLKNSNQVGHDVNPTSFRTYELMASQAMNHKIRSLCKPQLSC